MLSLSWAGAAKARTAKQLPDFVKAFGWCTWDAFYSRVSAEGEGVGDCCLLSRHKQHHLLSSCFPTHVGINEGLRALEEGGVPPKLLIIDDGWQTTELDAALRPPPSQEEVLRAEQEVGGRLPLYQKAISQRPRDALCKVGTCIL